MRSQSIHLSGASLLQSESDAGCPKVQCLHFKSLLQSESDGNLYAAIYQTFREYGKIYIKIRRDAKQMPFAFCQFTVSFGDLNFITSSFDQHSRTLKMLSMLSVRPVDVSS
jgi:hypothetical protein